MITQKIETAINEQINAETFSAYLYLSMSAYCQSINLKGFASWLMVQYKEETAHSMIFYNYLLGRGGKVKLEAIAKPQIEWKGLLEVFEAVLNHEHHITNLINNLMSLSIDEKDHATSSFLKWFVDEQVEEEANAEEMLQQLQMIEGKGPGLFMLDREAKVRVYNPPAPLIAAGL